MWSLESIQFNVLKEEGNYGEFQLGPLESGFGLTLGTALRRILLSSIEGVAPIALYIDGVMHEFSTVTGVKEDVEQIILNVKKLVVNLEAIDSTKLSFDVSGEQELTAGDLKHSSEVNIINPELRIATISSSKGALSGEIYIRRGKGYKLESEIEKEQNFPQTVIPVDANFSPVVKVNFHVEKMRFEESVDYDGLIVGILTKGNKTPSQCLKEAVEILINYSQTFDNLLSGRHVDAVSDEVKSTKISTLDIPERALNVLTKNNINTVEDLLKYSQHQLLNLDKFGSTSLKKVLDALGKLNLSLQE
ncbi:MAG: DNA-directed RNA polymerase subunit alpha [Caldisericaceae bacterium]